MNALKGRDILALGFMTFALFVGAGNIIFPPIVGLQSGPHVWLAALGFLITAVVCYLAVGPLFAIPRTATVSFEVGVVPLLGESGTALFVYSLAYFLLALAISLYPGRLLDTVGRFLAPLKILALAILGVAAFLWPAGPIGTAQPEYTQAAFSQGFVNGYLTMDTLAALVFGIVIVNAIRSRGVQSPRLITRYAIVAGLIAGVGLVLVYVSLFRLGAGSHAIAADASNGAAVLHAYVQHTVGLTCACAEYFCQRLPLSYRSLVIILAGFSFIVSNLGLTKLIQVSIPVLTAIYPPCIVLVALSFCIGLWHSATRILAPVMLVSLAFGVLDALKAAGLGQDFPQWLLHLPLAEQGLAWLIPSVATLAACSLVDRLLGKPAQVAA